VTPRVPAPIDRLMQLTAISTVEKGASVLDENGHPYEQVETERSVGHIGGQTFV
jgi:hypothetical protein